MNYRRNIFLDGRWWGLLQCLANKTCKELAFFHKQTLHCTFKGCAVFFPHKQKNQNVYVCEYVCLYCKRLGTQLWLDPMLSVEHALDFSIDEFVQFWRPLTCLCFFWYFLIISTISRRTTFANPGGIRLIAFSQSALETVLKKVLPPSPQVITAFLIFVNTDTGLSCCATTTRPGNLPTSPD